MTISAKNLKILCLLLTILAGFFLLYPFIDVQYYLSQGDHGRDLYAFEQTTRGAQVYRDYWWVYGPLMPLYYSGIDRWLGTNIQSILAGEMFLRLFSGLFIFLTLCVFFSALIGLSGAVWFWVFSEDFFFTYNHAGGIAMLTLIVYSLFLYLKNPRAGYLILGLIGILLLSLIKLNFGLSALLVFGISLPLIDFFNKVPFSSQKKYVYIALLALPIVLLVIYWTALKGLSIEEIRQCLPYLKGDQPYETSMWTAAQVYLRSLWQNAASAWPNFIFAFLLILSILQSFYLLSRSKDDKISRNRRLLMIAILFLFLCAGAHEYLMSGVLYRSYWMRPFQVLTMFAFMAMATENLSKLIQGLLFTTILLSAFLNFQAKVELTNQIKIPSQYLSLEKAKIFVGNSPQWIETINQTTEYLSTHLKNQETFFALPYDCLYYYLAGKTSPTRQLIFFEHIKIPPEQERKIIQDLENKHVDWVVISSRAVSSERGLGVLGKTYCPILGKYLEDNFSVAAAFGDWKNPPGWAWNHGTKILRRKDKGRPTVINHR